MIRPAHAAKFPIFEKDPDFSREPATRFTLFVLERIDRKRRGENRRGRSGHRIGKEVIIMERLQKERLVVSAMLALYLSIAALIASAFVLILL